MQMYPGAEKSLQNGEKPGFHAKTAAETGDTTETPEHEEEQKESRGLLIAFCIVAGTGYMFSMGVQMYMSSQITVIERAFGLSSSKSGILLSAGDIGFIVTVLFASHFLSRYVCRGGSRNSGKGGSDVEMRGWLCPVYLFFLMFPMRMK